MAMPNPARIAIRQRQLRIASWLAPDLVKECQENYADLLHLIQKNVPITFFVGAGISAEKPTSLPVASDLKEYLLKRWLRNGRRPAQPSYPSLEHIPLEKVLDIGTQVYGKDLLRCITLLCANLPPNTNHAFLARWLETRRGAVLTTNWDELIEVCLNRPSSKLDITLARGRLYKLHGTASDFQSLVATVSSLRPFLKGPIVDRLDEAFQQGPVCFAGWRGADVDLAPIIRQGIRSSRNPIFLILLERRGLATRTEYLQSLDTDSIFAEDLRNLRLIVARAANVFQAIADISGFRLQSARLASPRVAWKIRIRRWWHKSQFSNSFREQEYVTALLDSHVQRHERARDAFVHLAQTERDALAQASFWRMAGHRCFDMGDYSRAVEFTERALEIAKLIDDPLTQAWCLFGLGSIVTFLGPKLNTSFNRAPAQLEEAARLFHKLRRKNPGEAFLGEGASLSWYWRWQQIVRVNSGRLNRDAIIAGYKKAVRLLQHEKCKEPTEVVNPLRWMAQLEDCPVSRRHASEAVRIARAIASVQRLTTCLRTLAQAEERCGDREAAINIWWEELRLASGNQTDPIKMPDFRGVRFALDNLQRLYSAPIS